jgi:hypothetical protein
LAHSVVRRRKDHWAGSPWGSHPQKRLGPVLREEVKGNPLKVTSETFAETQTLIAGFWI